MKKLWISFAVVFFGSFAVLGWIGTRIYQEMPPIPAKVVDANGRVVVAEGHIERGQNVWQALGGMEVGSVWGHGSYIAPDWTADWLHREIRRSPGSYRSQNFPPAPSSRDRAEGGGGDRPRLRATDAISAMLD